MAAAKKTTKAAEGELDNKAAKLEALKTAMKQIEKEYGAGSIMRLGDNAKMEVSAVSSGSIALDRALGVGGIPRGRITEIYGPESSGKTTVALHVIAEVQKLGGTAAFIDAEHALDPAYAKKLGVDIGELLVSQPDYGEQALEIASALVNSGAVEIIVIDSVAALVPKQEIDGALTQSNVGLHARLMSKAMRTLAGAIAKSNTIVIFINQLREKVGVLYGNPEVTTGGKALKFYASVRIDVRKGEALKRGSEVYGNHIKCKVVKNKVASPFKTAEFDILYGVGISKSSEIVSMAVNFDIIKKSGAWFSYNGERLAQGKENAMAALDADPALFAEIEAKVRARAAEIPADEDIDGTEDIDDEFDIREFDLDD